MDATAPIDFPGVFTSLPMSDLVGFDDIVHITRALATVPSDCDDRFFTQRDEAWDLERAEVYRPPDIEGMKRREAEDALRKRAPTLLRKLGQEPQQLSEEGATWGRRKGHIQFSSKERRGPLVDAVSEAFGEPIHASGDFLYPRKGYRSWHTNRHDEPGWRMYLIQVDEPDRSFFRFIHPETGEMVTVWDRPDTVNLFPIRADRDFWHCIVSEDTNRFSQGFVVPADWSDRLR